MVVQKSTQTRVATEYEIKMTDKEHPTHHFLVTWFYEKECRDTPCLSFLSHTQYPCLCTFLHYHPYFLSKNYKLFFILVPGPFFK